MPCNTCNNDLSIYQILGRSHLLCVSDSFVLHNNISDFVVTNSVYQSITKNLFMGNLFEMTWSRVSLGYVTLRLNLKLSKEIFLRGSQYFPNSLAQV